MKTSDLKSWIKILGLINLFLMLIRTVLSYFLVTAGPFGKPEPNEARFFYFLTFDSIFHNEIVYGVSAALPVFLSSIIFILLLVLLKKHTLEITKDLPEKLFRLSVLFALISIFALPILAQDFWFSIAWGQMTAAFKNPYYYDLPAAFIQNVPIDLTNGLKTTYGPLWTLISTAFAIMSGGNAVIAAILFKLLLASAWAGSLYLVWQLLKPYSLAKQCIGIVIFGWLPLSIIETSAEGHNDILMVFFMLLWLYKLEKGLVVQATLALAAATLIKYAAAPLFAVEIFYLFISEKVHFQQFLAIFFKRYLLTFLIVGALMAGVYAIFFRSLDFFISTLEMNDLFLLTPRAAILIILSPLNVPYISYISVISQYLPLLLFWGAAFYCARRYYKLGTLENFRRVVLAVMTAILFTLIGQVWTWFLLWVIPLSALLPGSRISRWNIGAALIFPIAIIIMQFMTLPGFYIWSLPGLIIYIFAAAFLVVTQIIVMKSRTFRLL